MKNVLCVTGVEQDPRRRQHKFHMRLEMLMKTLERKVFLPAIVKLYGPLLLQSKEVMRTFMPENDVFKLA